MPKVSAGENITSIVVGDCVLKRSESGAEIELSGGKSFTITQPESSVLKKLIEADGQVVSKEELIIEAWGRADIIGPNSLPVAITNLRKVLDLGSIKIVNIPRQGYRLHCPVQAEGAPLPPRSATKSSPNEERPAQRSLTRPLFVTALGMCWLLLLLYGLSYILFSWVWVECYQSGVAEICRIRGDQLMIQDLDGRYGRYFYASQSGLMEVESNVH